MGTEGKSEERSDGTVTAAIEVTEPVACAVSLTAKQVLIDVTNRALTKIERPKLRRDCSPHIEVDEEGSKVAFLWFVSWMIAASKAIEEWRSIRAFWKDHACPEANKLAVMHRISSIPPLFVQVIVGGSEKGCTYTSRQLLLDNT